MPVPTDLADRYIAVWNQTDPAERRRAVDALWSPQARYVDPLSVANGREEIDAAIAAVQTQFPDYGFRLVGDIDAHHDQARFAWEFGPAGGHAPIAGFDVAVTDAPGRLELVLGFLDRVPAA